MNRALVYPLWLHNIKQARIRGVLKQDATVLILGTWQYTVNQNHFPLKGFACRSSSCKSRIQTSLICIRWPREFNIYAFGQNWRICRKMPKTACTLPRVHARAMFDQGPALSFAISITLLKNNLIYFIIMLYHTTPIVSQRNTTNHYLPSLYRMIVCRV